MNEIFISYSRRDKTFTLKLFEALKVATREVWADWEDIPPGSDWLAEIKDGIERSQAVIFILSPEWVKSRECAKELAYAVQMRKRLIPVVWQDVTPQDVPSELAKLNWIFLREGDDFEKGFQQLAITMDTNLEWLKAHTRLQTRALEWNNKNKDKSFVLRGRDLEEAEFQLATNTSKEPHPTDLQREYVFESRKAADKLRRTVTSISIAGAIIMTALAVFGFVEASLATKRANIARAGELASQVQLLTRQDLQGSNSTSLLLALEAMRSVSKLSYTDTIPARQTLYDALLYVSGTPLIGHTDSITSVAFSPDGRWLVTTSKSDYDLFLWDRQNTSAPSGLLSGHDKAIKAMLFSPDGHWLATGSEDNMVRLWDAQNFSNPAITLKGHAGSVNTLAFSPDGNWLASGSDDTTIRLWDLHALTAKSIVLTENTNIINKLAFSLDGHWLASSSEDFIIRLWDMKSSKYESTQLIGHTASISDLVFSPDGHWLASGSWDYTVRLWDLIDSANAPNTLESLDAQAITDLAFSPMGPWLAIASGGNYLRLWNTQDPSTAPIELEGHTSAINALAFSPNGKWLATGSADKTSMIWNVEDPGSSTSIVMKLLGHDAGINALAFSHSGQWLVSGGDDKVVRLWNLQNPSISPALLQESHDVLYAMTFSSDGRRLATGSAEGDIRLWDVSKHTSTILPNGHTEAISSLALSPDAHWLAAGNFTDNTLLLWNVDDPASAPLKMDAAASIYTIAFSQDGKQLFTASVDNTVQRWDIMDKPSTPTTLLPSQPETISTMALSYDGHWLAADNLADNTVSLWNLWKNSAKPKLLTDMDGAISALAFDHKDHWLAVGSVIQSKNKLPRNAIFLWDLQDAAKPPIILLGHIDRITALTFSADDHFLISGSNDQTARIWSMDTILNNTPSIPIHLQNQGEGITALALSPDSKTLVTANIDTDIQVWNLNAEELITSACKAVGRNLTNDEWIQFGFTETYRATCKNWQIENSTAP